MLILNPDVINSCRVCRSPNQDGEYECLYQFSTKYKENPPLSEAGILYENLLDISLSEFYHYPRFLCNSCDLQMKLFKKLKDKAYKTLECLKTISLDTAENSKDTQQIHLVGEEEMAGSNYEENSETGEEINQKQSLEFEECGYSDNSGDEFKRHTPVTYQKDVSNIPETVATNEYCHDHAASVHYETTEEVYEQCEIENLMAINLQEEKKLKEKCLYTDEDVSNAVTSEIGYNSAQDMAMSVEFAEDQFEENVAPMEEITKSSLNSCENISQLSQQRLEESHTDKNDYATEMYEVLDENPRVDTDSEKNSSIIEFDIYIEQKTDASSIVSDIEYIDEGEIFSQDEVYRESPKNNLAKKSCITSPKRKREYICKICQLEFRNPQEHKLHRIEVHHAKHICHVCSKELKSKSSLYLHLKLHNREPAYQCEICTKTFNQKAHYQYHMNNHNNVRNFKCNVCEKAFISKTDLKVHMRFHSDERPYVCNICGKDYLMMEHLKTHLLSHTDQSFQCETCNQRFTTHKTLRLHVRTIHQEEPKFKCNICLKPFRRKHHLQYHMKLHQKNVKYLDGKKVDNSIFNSNDEKCNPTLWDENEAIDDPDFIALNDDVL